MSNHPSDDPTTCCPLCEGEGVISTDASKPVSINPDAQALADVRTLDEWADRFSRVRALHRINGTGWACTLTAPLREELQFLGATPDEARAKAAAWVRGQAK